MASSDSFDPQLQLGQIIGSKYTLKSILGEGSFAVVFLGVDSIGNKFAIKCLYKQGLSWKQLKLQKEEVNILEELKTPSVISLLDSIETPLHFYMVLEYCEIDLFDFIMKNKLPVDKAVDLFGELCTGIEYCHSKGIYHRDLKPENILLTNRVDPHIKITDFGLSTRDQLSIEYGCGSVRYMAPECLKPERGKKQPYLSCKNDAWSLGIILINLLTSKNPWCEPNQRDKHFKTHLLNPRHSVDSFRSQFQFSDSFCHVLRRVFDLNPENRPTPMQLYQMVLQVEIFHSDSLTSNLSVPKKASVKHGLPTPSSMTIQYQQKDAVVDYRQCTPTPVQNGFRGFQGSPVSSFTLEKVGPLLGSQGFMDEDVVDDTLKHHDMDWFLL